MTLPSMFVSMFPPHNGNTTFLPRNSGTSPARHAASGVAPALLDYIQAIVEHTRRSPDYLAGLSPRAALALVHSARAWAMLATREAIDPSYSTAARSS